MTPSTTEYVPGVCNIGKGEVTFRYIVGWLGLAATIGLGIFFFVSKVEAPLRLFLGIPAFVAGLGLFQARQKFCVNYGMLGRYNMGTGGAGKVEQSEARSRDRQTSLRIIGLSLLMGLLGAALGYFLPVG